ncbi:deoxyribodipyrimidine photo-lyase [Hyphomonas sp.]|jgi:deoxyribodipyrimidine photo-lyase|uniref:FAD-binding domain-containing protein n=1 Tax=Hyphomonas sp. TaxID=87 RepID=UPI0025BCC327|nr:deoxyribodipyrimidine photo-lyase [Hyphomonas sp.]
MSGVHVVWFKRDLRVHDHTALLAAVASGAPVVPLYIFEPGYWAQPEHSRRQFDFVIDSLRELDAALEARGSRLVVRTGHAVDVFSALHREYGLEAIHAHEETGLQWTFDRDRQVRRWARNAGVSVREQAQHGVVRGLKSRDGWAARWEQRMAEPRAKAPDAIRAPALPASHWPIAEDFGLGADDCPARQPGGRTAGVECLRSFLEERGRTYRADMSSPLTGTEACSRLSPHLAFGTISLREAWQAARRARDLHAGQRDELFAASIDSFISRLHWHCHFIQKLEDQTSLESRNLHPAYDGLRPRPEANDPRLEAWLEGRTGFPFLDACMRSLKATGWLNFRMRAMAMGFAAHHLWLDWKVPAERLAARFTDFEPGIHYAQAQMQSATTGTNTPRIYNPVKQSRDQDPDGVFIRRWVPELAQLPGVFLHAPWEAAPEILSAAGIVLGQTYPMRMVDHMAAADQARTRIAAVRRSPGHAHAADDIQSRHGSRRAGLAPTSQRRRAATRRTERKAAPTAQLSLDLTHAS